MSKAQAIIRSRIYSFGYAAEGIKQLIRTEINMRIHVLAAVLVVIGGLVKGLETLEWVAIVISIGLVWTLEAVNTAIELLCNLVCNHNYHPLVKQIKDIAAASVLIMSAVSMVVAVLIFLN